MNLRGKKYTIPRFVEKMSKLKVILITNYGFHPAAELENLEMLNLLPNVKRIRLERVSIPSLIETRVQLKNLQKLSLFMCNINEAFKNCSIQVSDMMPNLVELNIDYCSTMVELPVGLCGTVSLKKLSITSCHKLSALPEEIGKLANLELLRVNSCSDLVEFQDSVCSLEKLEFLDISYCISLSKLPDNMGELHSLKELYITRCSRLCELPPTVISLTGLRVVVCDEDMANLWEPCKGILTDLHVEVTKANVGLEWL